MTRSLAAWDERTLDLAVERFTVGLDGHDAAELDRRASAGDLDELERAIAAVHLGALQVVEAPPPDFLQRLERMGRAQLATQTAAPRTAPWPGPTATPTPTPTPAPGRSAASASRALALAGWLVAAGLLAALTLVSMRGEREREPAARRDQLIASADDLVRVPWTASSDPAASAADGDVVWSAARQEGYLRFRHLAPNDPQQGQYQLWIFDPTRADWEARPVDGGVFDVSTDGEVIVPIDAKLAVREAALFAVTFEVPGGVVVSERERLVLTAAL